MKYGIGDWGVENTSPMKYHLTHEKSKDKTNNKTRMQKDDINNCPMRSKILTAKQYTGIPHFYTISNYSKLLLTIKLTLTYLQFYLLEDV